MVMFGREFFQIIRCKFKLQYGWHDRNEKDLMLNKILSLVCVSWSNFERDSGRNKYLMYADVVGAYIVGDNRLFR